MLATYLHARMLVLANCSGQYLLSLLLAPVFFLAGGQGLSQRQILLLLRTEAQPHSENILIALVHLSKSKLINTYLNKIVSLF